ncbi:uncharacterized protein [Rhodnius prolixus]|uniref:uncharacterized protein n=1 Tax=Rhodnius prolixus TaxID=13249 RepID=UPI003D18805D
METKSKCGEKEECIWLETLINKWAGKNLVARIIEMDLKNATSEGDNYLSIIYQAKLSVILCNGMKSKLSVIIKKTHESKKMLNALTIPVFKIEIKVYKEILRQFEVLMNEYQDYNEKSWCQLIGCRSYDTIVLEDLKVKNYVVADRKKMLDLNHSKLVLHSLGRFHALGYILIQKGLLQKEDLPPFYCDVGHITVQRSFKGGLMMLSNVVEKYWTPEWLVLKEIGDRLYKEQNVVMGKLKKLFEPQENDFITLCHGDCWTSFMSCVEST